MNGLATTNGRIDTAIATATAMVNAAAGTTTTIAESARRAWRGCLFSSRSR